MNLVTNPARDAHIELLLTNISRELAALRSIAVRTETRVCTLAEHIGAADKLQTRNNATPTTTSNI